MSSNQGKSLNFNSQNSGDNGGRNRIRFASPRKRAKAASADVYRNYKRRIGVTSAAVREERVHHQQQQRKRQEPPMGEIRTSASSTQNVATLPSASDNNSDLLDPEVETTTTAPSNFAEELDLALSRNPSEIFRHFYREVWYRVRSLPELLHFADAVIDLLLAYVVSPADQPEHKTSVPANSDWASHNDSRQQAFIVNLATTDIFHLLAVLARDLRHEIHPYVHTRILPRILFDLLNPPTTITVSVASSKIVADDEMDDELDSNERTITKQNAPLDVLVVESAFRAVAYIFRYDAPTLLEDLPVKDGSNTQPRDEMPCLDSMRQYYGKTLANKRELVRRLAAETFAPLVRKLPSDKAIKRHLRLVLRALAAAASTTSGEGVTTAKAMSVTQQRLQSDGVDGVARLLVEVSRGATGQMHSKGHVVVECVLESLSGFSKKHENCSEVGVGVENDLIERVASSFVEALCRHFKPAVASKVVTTLIATVNSCVEKSNRASQAIRVAGLLRLLAQTTLYRRGHVLSQGALDSNHQDDSDDEACIGLPQLVPRLLNLKLFDRLAVESQAAAIELACAAWTACPSLQRSIVARLFKKVIGLNPVATLTSSSKFDPPAIILTRELLCNADIENVTLWSLIGSTLLGAASTLAKGNKAILQALALVHLVATTRPNNDNHDNDDSFFYHLAPAYSLDDADRGVLLQSFQMKINRVENINVAQLAGSIQAVAFVAMTSVEAIEQKALSTLYTHTSAWLVEVLSMTSQKGQQSAGQLHDMDLLVVRCLAIFSLSRLSESCLDRFEDLPAVKLALQKALPLVQLLLMDHADSLWTVKSVASFAQTLKVMKLTLELDPDLVFEKLMPYLADSSHFRRRHCLEILATLPKRQYVVDHATLDFSNDLDEDPSSFATANASTKSTPGPIGPCDMIEHLLAIEKTPIDLSKERHLVNMIARVEILGRSGKLPVQYAEAAACQMLGLLHVKYSPVWPAAVKAIVALAHAHEDLVWPPLHKKIADMMLPLPCKDIPPAKAEPQSQRDSGTLGDFARYHRLCVAWDVSGGEDFSLFSKPSQPSEYAEVSRHATTDDLSVLESLWSVVECAPQLMVRHSRTIVPIFLRFMHLQYYGMMHPDDPDARELQLGELVSEAIPSASPDRLIDPRTIFSRLGAMLRAFATVNGPQQLFKHEKLFEIFLALLCAQDATIGKLSLSCILRYKPDYLLPYSEELKKMYARGKLREAMLQMKSSEERSTVLADHRERLIPLVSRIIFGRLASRAPGVKSSKDSPAARRAAALSFMSMLCESDEELFPFLYLMTRSYIPKSIVVKPIEMQDQLGRGALIQSFASISADDCTRLPSQVHQGFLNVLESLISQMGHRLTPFIQMLLKIVLSLCQAFKVKDRMDALHEVLGDSNDAVQPDEAVEGSKVRNGTIRTLCYRQLEDIFAQYGETVDFTDFADSMWNSMATSLPLLPEMAANAVKPPALLQLLKTLSSNHKFFPILGMHDDAVPCVLKCLSQAKSPAVTDVILAFISNLLGPNKEREDVDPATRGGRDLIQKHVPVLMDQFRCRLDSPPVKADVRGRSSRAWSPSFTWRRELDILCQVSQLIDRNQPTEDSMESICILLIPFLDHAKGASEQDCLSVLRILCVFLPRLSTETVATHYAKLAALFGPFRGKAGVTSKDVRRWLCLLFDKMSIPYPQAERTTRMLLELSAINTKRVDEYDYDRVMPALSSLANDATWLELCTRDGSPTDPALLMPLVFSNFHLLFDEDGVVARGAFQALKCLVKVAGDCGGLNPSLEAKNEMVSISWIKLLEGCVVPAAKSGLTSNNEKIRRFFILIFSEIVRVGQNSSSVHLYGDLACLIRDDEPDLDFFLSLTHVQLHRRVRALNRLRKMVVGKVQEEHAIPFGAQSVSNVLLPLAMHPVFECKSNSEEQFALEAIATVGAISRHLSWSKYNSTLWTVLTQFQRHTDQESFMVGLVCALIDGFSFETANSTDQGSNTVWRALENRFVPKIEELFTKEKSDRGGTKYKVLRPSIVLALTKLYKKFPQGVFFQKLPRLLAVICDSLRSRFSSVRDVARTTLAKMVVELDIAHLSDVVRELAISLKEGYQLHVRTASVHSILLALSEVYRPTAILLSQSDAWQRSGFDCAVPGLMDLMYQDLFGEAQERRDAEQSHIKYVKEAGGSKSANVLELMASMIEFRPSAASHDDPLNTSSVHALVSPLILQLRSGQSQATRIKRIREYLSRIVNGLVRNPSLTVDELLPFVFATVEPFVGSQEMMMVKETFDDDDNSDNEEAKAIEVSGKGNRSEVSIALINKDEFKGNVVEWRPSTLNLDQTTKAARRTRRIDEAKNARVQDGSTAPKLTGSSRYNLPRTQNAINDPANICGVVFGLQLLSSVLKKPDQMRSIDRTRLDPFVPLLTNCVCGCRDSDVLLLSLRCIGMLLQLDLPSLNRCSQSLATKTLDLLTSTGSASNQNEQIQQASFKMLTTLVKLDKKEESKEENSENALASSKMLPLNSDQMEVLTSFLQKSLTDGTQHNPAMGLLKALMTRRYISAGFYDVMETILEVSVRSSSASLREQAANVFVNYVLDYPLAEARVEQHMKQLVLNLKYKYADGRRSAVGHVDLMIRKLPVPVVENYSQLFFLPLALQLANDDSNECRELIARCIATLFQVLSTESMQSLFGYAERWLKQDKDIALQRMALQLYGIVIESRPDFVKRGSKELEIIGILSTLLADPKFSEDCENWHILYFSLVCIEKMVPIFQEKLDRHFNLWSGIVKAMSHAHVWVKLSSGRLVSNLLTRFDPTTLHDCSQKARTEDAVTIFLQKQPGSLFQLAKHLCLQLAADEDQQKDELTNLAVKSLTWVVQAMHANPSLCFEVDNTRNAGVNSNEGDITDDDDNDNDGGSLSNDKHTTKQGGRDPVLWVMTRLSNIAKRKGTKRRQGVFKCFGAFATFCGDFVWDYLELMLTPLHRSQTEMRNELEILMAKGIASSANHQRGSRQETASEESMLAKDVLRLLEEQNEKCHTPTTNFMDAYAAVQKRALEKREQRKIASTTEVIVDPQAAAQHRIQKQQRERKRRKRRVDEARHNRGGALAKKRRHEP